MVYSDARIEHELDIQKKYGITDIVVPGMLGSSIAAKIIKEKNKTFCRLCEKKFTEMEPPVITPDDIVKHVGNHFDEGFRATIEEITNYFS